MCIILKFSARDLQGVFICKENSDYKIILRGNTFTYVNTGMIGDLAAQCCDTLAVGTFDLDERGFLVISSPNWLNTFFINMDVIEKSTPEKDSIIFRITNPIETASRRNSKNGELEYSVVVQPESGAPDYFIENKQIFDESRIAYFNPKKVGVYSFQISIMPKTTISVKNIAVREVYALEYIVKDQSSNFFEINMPALNYEFISYRRLKGAYAKIIDKHTIIWEGKKFTR
jgi:hypothetical protein